MYSVMSPYAYNLLSLRLEDPSHLYAVTPNPVVFAVRE